MFSQPQPEPPSDQTFESNYDDDLSRTFKGTDVNTWQDDIHFYMDYNAVIVQVFFFPRHCMYTVNYDNLKT